jgi:hypothetical protein
MADSLRLYELIRARNRCSVGLDLRYRSRTPALSILDRDGSACVLKGDWTLATRLGLDDLDRCYCHR